MKTKIISKSKLITVFLPRKQGEVIEQWRRGLGLTRRAAYEKIFFSGLEKEVDGDCGITFETVQVKNKGERE